MTLKQLNLSAALVTLPSLLIVLVVPPCVWIAARGEGPEWMGAVVTLAFLLSIPLGFVSGTLGLACSFQRSLSWEVRLMMWVINLSAILIAVYGVAEIGASLRDFRIQLH